MRKLKGALKWDCENNNNNKKNYKPIIFMVITTITAAICIICYHHKNKKAYENTFTDQYINGDIYRCYKDGTVLKMS